MSWEHEDLLTSIAEEFAFFGDMMREDFRVEMRAAQRLEKLTQRRRARYHRRRKPRAIPQQVTRTCLDCGASFETFTNVNHRPRKYCDSCNTPYMHVKRSLQKHK